MGKGLTAKLAASVNSVFSVVNALRRKRKCVHH